MAANASEKPGCLGVLLSFLKRARKAPEALPYRLRDDFLSPMEFSFYKVLSSLLGPRFVIQSKVRLADIFFVVDPRANVGYFNKIAQRHLDFLVCDAATMRPLLGIELDDSSHKLGKRRVRDVFVDNVFVAAHLPLLRVPAQREYNARELAGQIAPLLKERTGASAGAPEPAPSGQATATSAPLCPKCGIPMVLRTVTQGKHKGKQFYGCRNYPRCREVKPFPIPDAG